LEDSASKFYKYIVNEKSKSVYFYFLINCIIKIKQYHWIHIWWYPYIFSLHN